MERKIRYRNQNKCSNFLSKTGTISTLSKVLHKTENIYYHSVHGTKNEISIYTFELFMYSELNLRCKIFIIFFDHDCFSCFLRKI